MLWVLKIHIKAVKRFSRGATTLIWLTHNCLCWTRAVSGACKIWVRLILTRWRPQASQLHMASAVPMAPNPTRLPFAMFLCGQCSFLSFNGDKRWIHLVFPPVRLFVLHVLALLARVRYTSLWDVGFCMKTLAEGSSRTAHTCSCAAQCPVVV